MAQDTDSAVAAGDGPNDLTALQQQIAGTRLRLSATLAALDREAQILLTPTSTSPRPSSERPRDAIELAATLLRVTARLRSLKRSGQLRRIGLSLAGLTVVTALLRSEQGQALIGRLRIVGR